MTTTNKVPAAESHDGPSVHVNWPVFIGSSVCIIAIALWAIIDPENAATRIGELVGWVADWFGWFYILLATVFLVFVIFLGVSRYGKVKLGPEHSKPDYGVFSWAAMLFAAGIGTDVMFFSVAEPISQYLSPPAGEGETIDAAREATVWTLFHYGITGWGMYALMGIALAYFAFRMNLPLSIRSAVYPIFGKRVYGPLGHGIDLAAIIGTIFGIATSLGIGVVQLNYGLNMLFDIPIGKGAQIGLVAIAVTMATISAISGVDKGIKRLSQLNVLLAIGLALFILVTGKTQFLLNAFVLNVGDFVSKFPGMTMQTYAFDQPEAWMSAWTLFFWAWWIAWASFVGLFLARISRGRTIRQFVAGTLIIPFTYILMWVSIFGNAAINQVRNGGDAGEAFGEQTVNNFASGFWNLLDQYPWFPFIASIAAFVGLLFYVTSADSGALVMGNLTSYRKTPRDDASPGIRIFWAAATGLLTFAMLLVGDSGITALQNATVIMGLPFAFVMVLLMFGLYKALRVEAYREESHRFSLPTRLSGRATTDGGRAAQPWRERLRRTMSLPDAGGASEFLDDVALPAMREVRDELADHDIETSLIDRTDESGGEVYVELTAELGEQTPFRYCVMPRVTEVPAYRSGDGDATYTRVEVHLGVGGQGYDVMGYSHTQLIDDVLDQYERHLEFLRLHDAPG